MLPQFDPYLERNLAQNLRKLDNLSKQFPKLPILPFSAGDHSEHWLSGPSPLVGVLFWLRFGGSFRKALDDAIKGNQRAYRRIERAHKDYFLFTTKGKRLNIRQASERASSLLLELVPLAGAQDLSSREFARLLKALTSKSRSAGTIKRLRSRAAKKPIGRMVKNLVFAMQSTSNPPSSNPLVRENSTTLQRRSERINVSTDSVTKDCNLEVDSTRVGANSPQVFPPNVADELEKYSFGVLVATQAALREAKNLYQTGTLPRTFKPILSHAVCSYNGGRDALLTFSRLSLAQKQEPLMRGALLREIRNVRKAVAGWGGLLIPDFLDTNLENAS